MFWRLTGTNCVKYDNFRIFFLSNTFLYFGTFFVSQKYFLWVLLDLSLLSSNKNSPKKKTVLRSMQNMRVIHKVRKTQHQNPEFGHTQGEIQKKTAQQYISIQGGDETQKPINFGGKLSFILSFLFPERLHCCYTYFHCSELYNYHN